MNGLEVKKKLKNNGYVFSHIAEKIEVTPQALQKIFKAKEVKMSTLERIAAAIDKDVNFFLGGTIKQKNSRERILEYLDYKGLTLSQFCEKLGVPINWINTIGTEISMDQAGLIMDNFKDVNIFWLAQGTEPMIIPDWDKPKEPVKVYPGSNMERILRNANEQAEEPVFDYEVINPELAVRQLLKEVFEKYLKIKELEKERDEWRDKYIQLLEEKNEIKEKPSANSA